MRACGNDVIAAHEVIDNLAVNPVIHSSVHCALLRPFMCAHYRLPPLPIVGPPLGPTATVNCTRDRPIRPSDDHWRAAGVKNQLGLLRAFHSWFRSLAMRKQGGTVTRKAEWTTRAQWNQTARLQSCLETTSIHCRSLEEKTSQFFSV